MSGVVTDPAQVCQADRLIFSGPIASRISGYEKGGGINQNVFMGQDKTEVHRRCRALDGHCSGKVSRGSIQDLPFVPRVLVLEFLEFGRENLRVSEHEILVKFKVGAEL